MFKLKWIFDLGFRHFDENSSRLPGWGYHMGFLCAVALWYMACFSLKLPQGFVLAILPFAGLFDLLGTWFLIRHSLRNIRKLGPFAFARPRFWIELSAVSITLGISCGVFMVTGGMPGIANWQQPLFELARFMCPVFVSASYVLTAWALLLGIVVGRKTRGPSLELVLFFFWFRVSEYPLGFLLDNFNAEAAGIVLAGIGLAALLSAGIIHFVAGNRASTSVE